MKKIKQIICTIILFSITHYTFAQKIYIKIVKDALTTPFQIKGLSTNSVHPSWIEPLSAQIGSIICSNNGCGGDYSFIMDKNHYATFIELQATLFAKSPLNVNIDYTISTGFGERIMYQIYLEAAKSKILNQAGTIIETSFDIHLGDYSKIAMRSFRQNNDGTITVDKQFGWDITTNVAYVHAW